MLPANDSSEPEAPLAAKLLEEGTLGIVIGASNLRDVLDSHFAQPASTLSEALIRFVKPGGSMTLAGSEDIEEAVRLVHVHSGAGMHRRLHFLKVNSSLSSALKHSLSHQMLRSSKSNMTSKNLLVRDCGCPEWSCQIYCLHAASTDALHQLAARKF